MTIKNCHKCGRKGAIETIGIEGIGNRLYRVICWDCNYHPIQFLPLGKAAIAEWNALQKEYDDPMEPMMTM